MKGGFCMADQSPQTDRIDQQEDLQDTAELQRQLAEERQQQGE
jgi:hypothetical protein